MEKFNTFKEVREKYKVTKWWHTPWHFSQSGDYCCFLEGGLECFKRADKYLVGKKR